MSKKPLNISEEAAVQMPMKTVASSDRSRGNWHHGLTLDYIETSQQTLATQIELMQKDLRREYRV